MQNWAGNYTFQAKRVCTPTSIDELRQIVVEQPTVRAVGTRHCFNDIADSPGGALISMSRLNPVISIDPDARQVIVEGGITYGQLAPQLNPRGLALHNLASLPHISIAGAVATATHGSGAQLGNLATAVAAIELMTADGRLKTILRSELEFAGAVVHLGCLGIVTKLTLDCVPSFSIAQTVYRNLPMQQFIANFDEILAGGYSASLFTDWQRDTINQIWMKCLPDHPTVDLTRFGATRATRQLHPIEDVDPSKCTDQLGMPGPWHERLPHFKLEFTPSNGEELQSEYFVPRDRAAEAYAAVAALREKLRPLIQICELRFITPDDLWLSGSYGRDTAAIHFTWRRDQAAVDALLHDLEAALAPCVARPHWGKRFVMQPQRLWTMYPRFTDFMSLADALDPHGKFRNVYCDRIGL